MLWPWTGYLAVFIEVAPAVDPNFEGVAEGEISLEITSPPNVRLVGLRRTVAHKRKC